ncbi:hypothetical protein LCGC14_0448860 [marine sediment metagenome]|uniref:DNA methylase N-4/N-6 domain-containing protein n=1 Tax=marine sediment metagenome TaxID=412755 RepID=A0A0F9SIB5_9ZZZZ
MGDWTNSDGRVRLLHGDCMQRMEELPSNSIDAIVTDPPYGLGFMSKEWDDISKIKLFHHKWAVPALRVLKPGGHILSCGGTRTYHRMVVALEDVGFEIRDCILWLYGSGFPKSQDIAKAIDKKLGVKSEVIGTQTLPDHRGDNFKQGKRDYTPIEHEITKATSDEAKKWEGWGTALKPAVEPVCLARKPLKEKTVASNVMHHGTGGLNIDASRIGEEDNGRYPSNVILDEEAAALLDNQADPTQSRRDVLTSKPGQIYGGGDGLPSFTGLYGFDDSGGPSRFFYTAKASKAERKGSNHPTIKPLDLMKYLVRLITPPGGTVLDPFAGSGTTLEAAYQLGFNAIGIEMDIENLTTIIRRHEQMAMRLE